MQVIEKRGDVVPSCKISSELIQEVTEILLQGATRAFDQDVADLGKEPSEKTNHKEWLDWTIAYRRLEGMKDVNVVLTSPERTVASSTTDQLRELRIPSNLSDMSIQVGDTYSPGYSARIKFDLKQAYLRQYEIRGRDAQLVNGVEETLLDKLRENSSRNGLMHKTIYAGTLSGLFAILAGWVALIVLRQFAGIFTRTIFDLLSIFLVVWFCPGLGIVTWKILHWLFPYFPYSEDRENSLRKPVTGAVVVIALSLVASVLYDSFKTVISTQTTVTTMTTILTITTVAPPPAGIAGFPGESIALGLILGLGLIFLAGRRRARR